MPFRNRWRAVAKTDKHEITWSNLAQNASTVQSITLSIAVPSADKNAATEVEIGSRISSIYFEFHFSAQVVTNPKVIHWIIIGVKPGETVNSPAVYYQNDRAIIFKRGMEMLPADQATVYKRIFVARVPKKFLRQTAAFQFQLRYISSSTETINACGIAIYKEQY